MEVFQFTADEIFAAVKMESSLFAERQKSVTKEGNVINNFSDLVFDEEYKDTMPMFRRLFFEAQAEIINVMPSSLVSDCECTFIEEDAPDDFMFALRLRCGEQKYNCAYFKVLSIKIKESIIAYIMYRWLETKLPDFAGIYRSRWLEVLEEVKKNVKRTGGGIGRLAAFPY